MIKKLLVVFVTFIVIQGYSQSGTASPYSFYGIGDVKFRGTVENRSMGGLSIVTDSIHMNLRNPASYAGNNLEVYNYESRPVRFTVGGTYSSLNLKTTNSESTSASSSFDYLALAIPMGKFGFGFGLLPYTSVGYKLESSNDSGNIGNRFYGQGGVNVAFLGLAYQFTKSFSLGLDMQYNFGNIENNVISFLYDGDNVLLPNQTREDNKSNLSGFKFNLGMSYKAMVSEKLELVLGSTFSPESNLNSRNERSISNILISQNTGREVVLNSIDEDLEALSLNETDLVLPFKLSFGAGLGQPQKWFAGAEYKMENMSSFSNPLFSVGQVNYEDSQTYSLGGFFIPEYNAFSGYFKRVTYRAGVRYKQTGIVFEQAGPNAFTEPIDEFGISFGLGLPVGNGISSANLSLEIGQRGTTNNNLIQENFINFQLSLSLNDRWFVKRKYN